MICDTLPKDIFQGLQEGQEESPTLSRLPPFPALTGQGSPFLSVTVAINNVIMLFDVCQRLAVMS